MTANNILQLLSNLSGAGNSAFAVQPGSSVKGGQPNGAAFQNLLAQLGNGSGGEAMLGANGQSIIQQLTGKAGQDGQAIPANVMTSINGILAHNPEALKALVAVNASGALDKSAAIAGMPALANQLNAAGQGEEIALSDILGLTAENSVADITELTEALPAELKAALLNIVVGQIGEPVPGQTIDLSQITVSSDQLGDIQAALIASSDTSKNVSSVGLSLTKDGTITLPLAAIAGNDAPLAVQPVDLALANSGATKIASANPMLENPQIVSSLPETANLGTLVINNGTSEMKSGVASGIINAVSNASGPSSANIASAIGAQATVANNNNAANSAGKSPEKGTDKGAQNAAPNVGPLPTAEQAINNSNAVSAVQRSNSGSEQLAVAQNNTANPAATPATQTSSVDGIAADSEVSLSAIATGKSANNSANTGNSGQNSQGQPSQLGQATAHNNSAGSEGAKTAAASITISQPQNTAEPMAPVAPQQSIDTALSEAVAKVHTRPVTPVSADQIVSTNIDTSAPASTSATGNASLTSAPTLAASLANNNAAMIDRASLYTSAAVASNVGLQIAKAVSKGQTDFAIRIDPPELGRLHIKLEFGSDTGFKAIVTANNRDTFNMLQRDAHMLEKALEEAGLEMDEGSLSFSLNEGDADASDQRQANKNSNGNSNDFENALLGKDAEDIVSEILPYVDLSRALDIRV